MTQNKLPAASERRFYKLLLDQYDQKAINKMERREAEKILFNIKSGDVKITNTANVAAFFDKLTSFKITRQNNRWEVTLASFCETNFDNEKNETMQDMISVYENKIPKHNRENQPRVRDDLAMAMFIGGFDDAEITETTEKLKTTLSQHVIHQLIDSCKGDPERELKMAITWIFLYKGPVIPYLKGDATVTIDWNNCREMVEAIDPETWDREEHYVEWENTQRLDGN